MKLYTSSCYNPFFIDIGAKTYELENIHFFDSDGVICSSGRGWFGSNNYFRNGLEIAVDVFVKKKPDFSLSVAFLLSTGEKSWATNKTRYELYIPAAVVGLKAPTISEISRSKRYYIVTWESNIQGVFCTAWRYVDATLSAVEHEINEVGETIKSLYQSHFDELPELLKRLQKLEKERQKAIFDIEQITPESILNEYTGRYNG